MSAKRRTSICYEGWYYLIILVFILGGAILRDINLLMLVAGLMAGPILLNWRLAVRALRNVQVRRLVTDSASAGEVLEIPFQLTNPRRRFAIWGIEIRDVLKCVSGPAAGKSTVAKVLLTNVGPGETVRGKSHGRLTHRGRYRFGRITVTTSFPFGLVRRRLIIDQSQDVMVTPRLGQLTPGFHRLFAARDSWGTQPQARLGFAEGDFYGLRDWRSGDSRRWIHWRTSARSGTLMVRQFQQQQCQDLVLLLDLSVGVDTAEEKLDAVESIVSLAASVGASLCRQGGGELTLVVIGARTSIVQGIASSALCDEIMEQLVDVQPAERCQLDADAAAALNRVNPGTNLLLLSAHGAERHLLDDVDERATEVSAKFNVLAIDASTEDVSDYLVYE